MLFPVSPVMNILRREQEHSRSDRKRIENRRGDTEGGVLTDNNISLLPRDIPGVCINVRCINDNARYSVAGLRAGGGRGQGTNLPPTSSAISTSRLQHHDTAIAQNRHGLHRLVPTLKDVRSKCFFVSRSQFARNRVTIVKVHVLHKYTRLSRESIVQIQLSMEMLKRK